MPTITKIEGIGIKYAKPFQDLGIRTTEKLLEAGSTRAGRDKLAKQAKLSNKLILKWVNRADLYRVKGIGEEYGDLLEVAGVDTVVELAQRKAENLREALASTNAKKKLVRRSPGLKTVQGWIRQAKKLKRAVTY